MSFIWNPKAGNIGLVPINYHFFKIKALEKYSTYTDFIFYMTFCYGRFKKQPNKKNLKVKHFPWNRMQLQ